MMRCKYWDCGWCYCKTGKSNDINGKCMTPMECPQMSANEHDSKQETKEGYQMTEQNIRDAFELHMNKEMNYHGLSKTNGVYTSHFVHGMWISFKAGWIAAFKVILESENE